MAEQPLLNLLHVVLIVCIAKTREEISCGKRQPDTIYNSDLNFSSHDALLSLVTKVVRDKSSLDHIAKFKNKIQETSLPGQEWYDGTQQLNRKPRHHRFWHEINWIMS